MKQHEINVGHVYEAARSILTSPVRVQRKVLRIQHTHRGPLVEWKRVRGRNAPKSGACLIYVFAAWAGERVRRRRTKRPIGKAKCIETKNHGPLWCGRDRIKEIGSRGVYCGIYNALNRHPLEKDPPCRECLKAARDAIQRALV